MAASKDTKKGAPRSLSGRAKECQLLSQAYKRSQRCEYDTCAESCILPQELVLIQGRSGTGKTTLAESILDDVIGKDAGFFLCGKFELCSFQNPYEVFVSAFAKLPEMVHDISTGNNDAHELSDRIGQAIREAVGSEGKLLTDMIPALEKIIGQQDEVCQVQGMEALNRFKFVFSKFVRAVSSVVPLVLFLDDLQWSDPASLSLLQVILETKPDPNQRFSLLVICAFRDEGLEVAEQSQGIANQPPTLSVPIHFRDFLHEAASSTLVNVTKISLKNLDTDSTVRLVGHYLDVSTDISEKLGHVIFSKCEGNPFHAVQLLSPLLKCKTLQSNGSAKPWKWNEGDIFEIAEAAYTVDELLCQKLSLLSEPEQKMLQAAACMGDCIDHPALCTIFDGNVSSVEDSLRTAVRECFLVFQPKLGQYRFAHDRVRQAALSMIDDVECASFRIGHQLWTKATPLFLSTKMFVVATLLNNGTKLLTDQSERYKAAAINLEAGLKAMSLAAFPDACRFLRGGMDFLVGGDFWNEQYDLTLNLFNVAADAELCNQKFDRVAELVDEILKHARTVKDKLRANVALINSLGQRGNMDAALQVGIEVSKQLVEPLPPKVTDVSILVEIIKTKIALRGRSNSTLLSLPPLQDDDRIAAMYILTNLVTYTFQAASNYCPLIGARIVRLCLKHGMHKWCSLGFVTLGFVMCAFDRNEGYRLGTLALNIIDRYRGKELLPRVHMYFYGLIHHWKHPLAQGLKPLQLASKVGMEIGDVEDATTLCLFHASHCLYHGRPLAHVEDLFNDTTRRMRLFRQESMLSSTLPILQYIHNLTGRAPVPKLLAGEVTPLYASSQESDSLIIPYSHYCLGAELAFMFGDLDLAVEMLEKKRRLRFDPLSFFYYSKFRLKEALICTSLVRSNRGGVGKRRNLKIAKAGLNQLKAWAKDCSENFQHKQHLVEAELKSLSITSGSSSRQRLFVRQLYDVAIDRAVKTGFVEEAALANELAGDFMSRQNNDINSAVAYWDEARTWYLRWGATEKAKHLSTRHSMII